MARAADSDAKLVLSGRPCGSLLGERIATPVTSVNGSRRQDLGLGWQQRGRAQGPPLQK